MSKFASFLRVNRYSIVWLYTTFCLSIHPSIDTWTASIFWLLWIMLLWTWVYKYLFLSFSFFGYVSRTGIVGAYGNSMFSVLRNHCTVFHSGCTILQSHQQCTGFQFLYILAITCYFLLLIAILMDVKRYLTVVLVFVSLMISDVEHLFMCLSATHIFLGEVSVQVLIIF